MKWWNGIWLNEAFATFMEMKATEAWRPDWQRWVEFGLSRTAAMETDALDTTRPIEFHVESPDEAEGMFDILTYEKGGAVLRMLEQYLGEDRFRDGVRRYLADHAYGNTENTDLWDAIEAVTGEPVRRIMDSWIFQGGHPIVSVERRDGGRAAPAARSGSGCRRPSTPTAVAAEDLGDMLGRCRWCSASARADGATRERCACVLEGLERDRSRSATTSDWVVVNAGGEGAYRVHYSADLREALVAHGIGNLEVLERYGILNDAYAATLDGALSTPASCSSSTRAYADEADVAVWKLPGAAPSTTSTASSPDDARAGLAGHVRALAGPALRRLGFTRPTARTTAPVSCAAPCSGSPPSLGDDAGGHRRGPAAPRRRAGVARIASIRRWSAAPTTWSPPRRRDGEAFQLGLARYGEAATPQEEVRELYALARTDDEDVLRPSCCELALTEIRTQNAPYLLRGGARRTAPRRQGRGSSSAATGTRSTSASRRTRSSACSRASGSSPTRRWPPTCRGSSPSTRCRRAPSSWRSTSSARRPAWRCANARAPTSPPPSAPDPRAAPAPAPTATATATADQPTKLHLLSV